MRWILLIPLALCGCESRSARAEKEYAIVRKSGSADDICSRGKAVADAYLAEQNADKYNQASVEADIYCQSARSDEARGIFRMPDGTKRDATEGMDDMIPSGVTTNEAVDTRSPQR